MSATGNKFKFKLNNASASDDCIVAMLAGNVDTTKVSVTNVITQSSETPFAVSAVESTAVVSQTEKANLVSYGIPVDAVMDDGTILTDVTATASDSKYKIRHFHEYIKNNPQIITKMVVEASNSDVFQETLFIQEDNPLNGTPSRSINLSDFLGTGQNIDTKIELIGLNLPLTDQTIMWMNVPKSRSVSITLYLAPIR
jgi:hypothetical protein